MEITIHNLEDLEHWYLNEAPPTNLFNKVVETMYKVYALEGTKPKELIQWLKDWGVDEAVNRELPLFACIEESNQMEAIRVHPTTKAIVDKLEKEY